MKALLVKLLKNKKLLVALVIVALLILLWFGLYFAGVSSKPRRLAVFLGLFSVLGLAYVSKLIIAKRRGGSFLKALNAQVTSEHQLEVDALQEKMKEAIEKLKASGAHTGHRGSAALYALPWYMIIGPSAAGKSTLLRNSDLNFPYSVNDQIDIKGFAGTRNCDWWFADEAIILDTAGRYTLEESDKPEWLGFLQLLRNFRSRSPINGVIVAMSLEDIISSDKQRLNQHVNLVRQKIDELNHHLGIVIPVQLVITKCDLIQGFSNFFKDLSQESREQPWGARVDNQNFKGSLAGLVDKLSDWRLQKLPMNPQLEHKHEIMKFPCEFERSLEKVTLFLESLTKKNHFQEQPDFRGVYFTSALQDSKLQADLNIRSYFIKDLFRKIIFQQKTTSKNAQMKMRQNNLVWGGAALCFAVIMTVASLLHRGYELQTELYAKESVLFDHMNFGSQASAYEKFENTVRLYQHYSYLKDLEAKNYWRFIIGFDSLQTQIDAVEALFATSFSRTILPVAQHALRENLHRDSKLWLVLTPEQRAKNYAHFYDNLKATLMLGSPEKLDPDFVAKILYSSWGNQITSKSMPNEAMFLAFFKAVKDRPELINPPIIDPTAVKTARDALVSKPDPKVLYQHLVSRGSDELGLATLQDLMKGRDQGMLVSAYPMPKMYTKNAFKKSVLPMMQAIAENAGTGDWVLQEGAQAKRDKKAQQKWINELRALYFQDYAKHWLQWTASLQIKGLHSLDDAATKLARLQKDDGAIIAAVSTIDQNLGMDAPELKQIYEGFQGVIAQGPGKTPNTVIAAYLKQLAVIQSDLSALGGSSDPYRDAEVYARKVFENSAESSLSVPLQALNGAENLGSQQKQAMNAFLRSPLEQSWRAILNAAAAHIQQQWEAEVIDSYNHSLRGKFPFAKTHIEVALDDVTSFFNPSSGHLSQFHELVLKPYLKQNKGVWQEQEWLGQGIGFSKSFLNGLTQGQQISHALFKSQSSDPEFSFYIQPVPLAGIEEVIFDSNGQQYRYRNEPEEWRRFTWPGDASQIGARLFVSSTQQGRSAEIEHHGIWGLFHLLSDAKFVKQGGTQYMTEWQLRDKSGQALAAKIRIKADKQSNVLDPRILMQFKLPEEVTDHSLGRG
jgi:type VI secretion system protein ImpL